MADEVCDGTDMVRQLFREGQGITDEAGDALPVWLKYCAASSCLAIIIAEQSTEALPPDHVTHLATNYLLPCDQLVVETLMIALVMIMGEVLLDRIVTNGVSLLQTNRARGMHCNSHAVPPSW
jgi:hypothetical protein